ncbi:unnamed protein product [Prorocentrum cordatum]|uniref:Uncharacterized protein n=1 Tax=Prorocentrum cordatum TaxID=2364126 RepID=A0ABN9Q4A9_9DINO|nr:unnamed protein product [Polarella glacialis]
MCAAAARPRPVARRPAAAAAPESAVVLSSGEGSACAGPGASCQDSKCCLDGGAAGYQCFAKNDDWAQCLESCEKGPHEDETDGEYDQYGNFKKFEWGCKKLGERSKKGCDSIGNKTECSAESERCTWGSKGGKDACLITCAVLPADDACSSQDHCMVHDGKCQPSCDAYGKEQKCPTERCMWGGDQCMTACWAIHDQSTCEGAMWDPRGCIWQGGQCLKDPCSGGDENCLDTSCCSSARGGMGKTCFRKDKYYGKCMELCEKADDTEGWDCEALGNRTRFESGCAFIGHSCADTGLCCSPGSACVVKDEHFTGCIQTQIISTWSAQSVPIPSDWEGTTIGGSRDEYQMQAAGEGEDKADATLFCFMAYLPDSGEVPLRDVAKELGASIYGCDGYAEFESWGSGKKVWDTGDGGASITNTDVFLNVWQQVQQHGGYMKADWTVKVDPDAVMVADRLKSHIYGLNAKKDVPIYLKNNNMDPGLGNNGFLGAIEVFSKRALQIYFDNWEGCKEAYGLDSGEDGFMKGCMDALGVGFMTDGDMFDPDFSPGACAHAERAAFHPLKEASQWRCCWDIIQGKTRDVKYGKCDMGPDGRSPPEPEYGGTAR